MTVAVSLVRSFNYSPEEVFRHFVDPELLIRWFYPEGCRPEYAILEPRVGGLFAVDMRTVDGLMLSVRSEVSFPAKIGCGSMQLDGRWH